MKKFLLLIVSFCFFFSACNKGENIDPLMVDVQVTLTGMNISVIPEGAKSSATEASVNHIILGIYDLSGNLVQSVSQNRYTDPTNFGTPINIRLSVGSYKFVAIAHSTKLSTDPIASINSATEASFGSGLVNNPTYTTVQDVTISGNGTQSISIDMGKRKNAAFTVKITDDTPADVQTLELIVNPSGTIYTNLLVNPATGLATDSWQYRRTIARSSITGLTFTNNKIGLPLFLTASSVTLDVTINALGANDTVLYTRSFEDVTFQQAHKTLATGTFFSPMTTNTFTFNVSEITDTISLD